MPRAFSAVLACLKGLIMSLEGCLFRGERSQSYFAISMVRGRDLLKRIDVGYWEILGAWKGGLKLAAMSWSSRPIASSSTRRI